MTDEFPDTTDEALSRRLGAELPRYAPPPTLRAALARQGGSRRPRLGWVAPALASMATALVLGLFFVPGLPRPAPQDPVQRFARAVIAEHTRTLMWGTRRGDFIPAALPWLTQESGIGLARMFEGDATLVFIDAEPVYLEGRRGVALHYRDADGHLVTYAVLPAPGLRMPERERVPIAGRFRPALLRESGFAAWFWKQGELACFMVSDMVSDADLERFKDYFVRVRVATEPFPVY
jgi:hypothetical protein